MSYCRWSSDRFQCDVYVYESSYGWVIHVAWRRRAEPGPLLRGFEAEGIIAYEVASKQFHENDESAEWVTLPKSHAGKSYIEATPGACADRLEEIRQAGLNVPQYVIDELREEQAEEERPGGAGGGEDNGR